jgi:hypothetical protein
MKHFEEASYVGNMTLKLSIVHFLYEVCFVYLPKIALTHIPVVKKYMLQRSVVDRWVQSDHILLIHSYPETLPFSTKGHKSFREHP